MADHLAYRNKPILVAPKTLWIIQKKKFVKPGLNLITLKINKSTEKSKPVGRHSEMLQHQLRVRLSQPADLAFPWPILWSTPNAD